MFGFLKRLTGGNDEPQNQQQGVPNPAASSVSVESAGATVSATPGGVQVSPGVLSPLTVGRIKSIIESNEWSVEENEHGGYGGRWDNAFVRFRLEGNNQEIFHINAFHVNPIPHESLDEVLGFIEDRHRNTFWPKAYIYHDEDNDQYRLHAEHNVDFEYGASDEQLNQQIHCALQTTVKLFQDINEQIPFPEVD